MRAPDSALGPRLKAAREGVPLTQCRAAILLGVSTETLSNWERSKTQPLAGDLVGICTLYKVSPLALLGMTTDRTLGQFEPRPPQDRTMAARLDMAGDLVLI